MLLLLNARGKGCKRLARRVAICLRERDRTAACARKTGAVARYEDITPTHYAIQNALGLRGCFMRALAAQGRRRDENTGGGDARARDRLALFFASLPQLFTRSSSPLHGSNGHPSTRARAAAPAAERSAGRRAHQRQRTTAASCLDAELGAAPVAALGVVADLVVGAEPDPLCVWGGCSGAC